MTFLFAEVNSETDVIDVANGEIGENCKERIAVFLSRTAEMETE
jgi:hypothetical protein